MCTGCRITFRDGKSMKQTLWIVFLICAGIVAGSLVAELTADIGWLSWLSYALTFGLNPPFTLDMGEMCIRDSYRIESEDDLYSCGYDDYFRPGIVIAAEWCERIPYALPSRRFEVKITGMGDSQREIIVTAPAARRPS